MKTIYKYPLAYVDQQQVAMPAGARILSAAVQHGQLCIWALVDAEPDDVVSRLICMRGTGHRVPDAVADMFIGTILSMDGTLVFHIFADQK